MSVINDINHTAIERDVLGLVQKVTQGEANLSQPEVITNPLVREYQYDDNRFLESIQNPETGLTVYGRDEVGNQTAVTVDNSPTTTFHHDGANRLYLIDYPPGTEDISIGYDDNHRVVSVGKGTTQWSYDYDENGNFKEETLTIGDEPAVFQFLYGYDALDALASVTYPNGVQVDYAPDALGRATQAMPFATDVSYHPNGQVHEVVLQNGVKTVATLNTRQFVEGLTAQRGTEAAFVDYLYDYDETGNVAHIEDLAGPDSVGPLVYDALDRLKSTPGAWGDVEYAYSAHGDLTDIMRPDIGQNDRRLYYAERDGKRRLHRVHFWALDGRPSAGVNFEYDVYGNQLNNAERHFRYDDASNLVASAYDFTAGTDNTYEYDGNDHRFREIGEVGKRFTIYGKSGKLLFERDSLSCEDRAYVHLGSMLIARENTASLADDDNSGVADCLEDDPDGDGLSNQQEDQLNTHRNDPDSDNDGIDDGFEAAIPGLNPTQSDDANEDLDGDGVPNLQEFLDGTGVDNAGDFLNAAPIARDDEQTLLLSLEEYPSQLGRYPGVVSGTFELSRRWSVQHPLHQPDNTVVDRLDALAVGTDDIVFGVAAIDSPQRTSAEIAGVLLDKHGRGISEQIKISDTPTRWLINPKIAALDDGFVVVWSDKLNPAVYGAGTEIFGRIVGRDGTLGDLFTIATGGTHHIFHPKVAKTADGGFVVVWQQYFFDPVLRADVTAIKARRYSATGVALTDAFDVHASAAYELHRHPVVAALPSGGFVVVWSEQLGNTRLAGRRFGPDNQVLGNELAVEEIATANFDVAVLPDGAFFVVWQAEYLDSSNDFDEIAGRFFDPQGNPKGTESFIINKRTFGKQVGPIVRVVGPDEVVVAWGHGDHPFGYDIGDVFAQGFHFDGTKRPTEDALIFRTGVSGMTPDAEGIPNAILTFADGSYVITSPKSRGAWFGKRHAGTVLTVDVLHNDEDPDLTDTRDRLQVTSASVREGTGNGSAQVVDNQILFDAGADFNHLSDGASATVHIDYTVEDDSGATDEGTLTEHDHSNRCARFHAI